MSVSLMLQSIYINIVYMSKQSHSYGFSKATSPKTKRMAGIFFEKDTLYLMDFEP